MARVLITESKRYAVYERKDTVEFITSDGKELKEIVFSNLKDKESLIAKVFGLSEEKFDSFCSELIYHEGDAHELYQL
jgi:hypothetical protein